MDGIQCTKYDRFEQGVHIITDLKRYIETLKGDGRYKLDDGEDLLSYKRRIGLIDPPEVEAPEDVDEGYEEIMARKWGYIVVKSATQWGNKTMMDELISAGQLGLLNAIRTWNMSKGTQNTYYTNCVKNAMRDAMRKEATYSRYIPFSLNDATRDSAGSEGDSDLEWLERVTDVNQPTPEELLLKKEQVDKARVILANVIGAMTEREQFVFHHRILEKSMTLEEIAEKYGCSHMAIKRDEERIKEKLKELKEE